MQYAKPQPQPMHTEPESVRRKLVVELRKLATGKRFTPKVREEIAAMADQWQKTLPEYNINNLDVHQG
jgi:hypothetical protein